MTIHKIEDFASMRAAGKLAAKILDYIADYVEPGVTTERLNELCHNKIIENNAIPAPLNYKGFPKSICTSINHVVCHGIPDDRKLKDGDIINIDVTVILDGWYGDTSRMFFAGTPSIKAKRLCEVTYDATMYGIEQVKPGNKIYDIANAIQNHAEKHNFSVVRDYCGHGLGRVFHTEPSILHYARPYSDAMNIILQEGMFFTVEPMINAGKYHTKLNQKDGWTVWTKDKSLSAQFEHSMGVTSDGVEIFTESLKGLHKPWEK